MATSSRPPRDDNEAEAPAPEPVMEPSSRIVPVTPKSSGVVTVPSGASFQLVPGVELQMQERDAQFLVDSGMA